MGFQCPFIRLIIQQVLVYAATTVRNERKESTREIPREPRLRCGGGGGQDVKRGGLSLEGKGEGLPSSSHRHHHHRHEGVSESAAHRPSTECLT